MARVTAVFDDRTQAERAVTELRRLGWKDTELSIVARSEDEAVAAGASPDTAGQRAAKGAAGGGGCWGRRRPALRFGGSRDPRCGSVHYGRGPGFCSWDDRWGIGRGRDRGW